MKIIAINDANILIDLMKIDLIDEFFRLDFEFITTNFIIAEFEMEEQQNLINELIRKKKLYIYNLSFDELTDIQSIKFRSSKKLSFEDCSVWYLAKKKNAILLTGDNLLRKKAINDGVSVNGILFVIDYLIENEIITKQLAFEKLKKLLSLNARLPKNECEIRLNTWKMH